MIRRCVLILACAFVGAGLVPHQLQAAEAVAIQRAGDRVTVLVGGKPFTAYYFGPEYPKPFLHPLRSAEGTIVTRQWPMVKNIPGESHDHPHHRGMFFAHGDINGVDFWGEASLNKKQQTVNGVYYSSEDLPKGRTSFRKLEEARGGPDTGVIRADFSLVGPGGKVMGSEVQAYTFRGTPEERIIDCEFTLRADRGVPLKLGDTKEGTFAIRVVKGLHSPPARMTNSNGAAGEKAIWGKKADWVDYSGKVGTEEAGITVFDSPENFRHPTTWHARGYGLFAVNPFGLHDFENNPKVDGSYTIPAGGQLALRYRVLIHHGDESAAELGSVYHEYAESK